MEAVNSSTQLGEIFNRSLQNFENISDFIKEIAKTIAQMHAAFLRSKKPDFQAMPATDEDICLWYNRMNNNFSQALSALKRRSLRHPDETLLANLIPKLESLTIRPLSPGSVMKAQIHGDLHADQGIMADRICWLDFEGPPAKEPVAIHQDFRENPLLDLAGMIQAFWYMAHIRLYELSGFDYQHPEDHEKQRHASLAFAGIYDAPKSEQETICRLKSWVEDMTSAFIESYLDEIETLNIHASILKSQDRSSAKTLINYWVSDRAIHELRYETYGRSWGWEAIPASRIIPGLSR
jgi:predicted trehalose synthase